MRTEKVSEVREGGSEGEKRVVRGGKGAVRTKRVVRGGGKWGSGVENFQFLQTETMHLLNRTDTPVNLQFYRIFYRIFYNRKTTLLT